MVENIVENIGDNRNEKISNYITDSKYYNYNNQRDFVFWNK